MVPYESYNLSEQNSLFEIPIYRLDPNSFEKELQKKLDNICNPIFMFEKLNKENVKEKYNEHRRSNELNISYPWKFNEIIGWILISIDREYLHGYLFYKQSSKNTVPGTKGKIIQHNESFTITIAEEMTNLEIYLYILTELKGFIKRKILKDNYIDTNRFETIGKYINWKNLFFDLNN